MSTFVTFAKNRALDHLWDLHGRRFNIALTEALRFALDVEMRVRGWRTEADLKAIGCDVMERFIDEHGLELVCSRRRK